MEKFKKNWKKYGKNPGPDFGKKSWGCPKNYSKQKEQKQACYDYPILRYME